MFIVINKRSDKLVAVKIVLAGDGAVGKSTISNRLSKTLNTNEKTSLTPGLSINKIIVPKEDVSGIIWDLGGQKQFRFLHNDFIKGAKIVILVYSVEWIHSLKGIKEWLDIIPKDKIPSKIYLIANKVDSAKRVITQKEGENFAKENNITYYEISATNGEGFEQFEDDLIETIKIISNPEKELTKEEVLPSNYCSISSSKSYL
ncbi:MAG: GTP-binding protein Der [Candidatus Methanofastidiosum methylothiophilum]|uniref:GTP-binding protein Der n=1 Tax=Candidatus Methanofastidiosum methylothiophilum TaxID=1705564 RepID=A0A150ILD0_9EURY|nr:MAG: GTP-binding protein Der [Candidatus Methanofastidiosum methylthiophilus]KYC48067.1 MAG: GTP-binding protein Der [Candidatus Methanofastidiosum methylthiophilus]KYC50458.1 MAG: GTP-binding protein Der [Candidatus Methanofastidiosum methylthiophilus]